MRSRNSSWLCALAVSTSFAQGPAKPPEHDPPASIAGEVRDAVTGAPIERAHVVARKFVNGNVERYGAFTTADGKFLIGPIPGGGYTLSPERTGFVDLNGDVLKSVSLSAGEKKENRNLKLTPTGAIVGRVLDADGAPAEGVSVIAVIGRNKERSAVTDDRGMFRLGGLRPAKFRVKAQPMSLPLPPEIRTDGTVEVHYANTYHPSVLDPAEATRVEVKAAAEVAGIDIRLIRTPIIRVAGKVAGMPAGAQNANISLPPQGFGTQARPDGTFEVWRIDPGKYTIAANVTVAGQNYSSAPMALEVGQSDVENLVLQLIPPIDVQGQLEFDDEEVRTPPQPQGPQSSGPRPGNPMRRIYLRRSEGFTGAPPAEVHEDGTFTLAKVPPGKYRLTLSGGPGYVKSMRLGPTPIEGPWLDLISGAGGAPLSLRIASAKGVVSGVVRDDKGPVGGARILLVEPGGAGDILSSHTNTSKEDGSYSFSALPPGVYWIRTIDETDLSGNFQRMSEDLEDLAEKVEIRDRETIVKDLRKSPR